MTVNMPERFQPYAKVGQRTAVLPDLAEIQKASFEWFLREGLSEEL